MECQNPERTWTPSINTKVDTLVAIYFDRNNGRFGQELNRCVRIVKGFSQFEVSAHESAILSVKISKP